MYDFDDGKYLNINIESNKSVMVMIKYMYSTYSSYAIKTTIITKITTIIPNTFIINILLQDTDLKYLMSSWMGSFYIHFRILYIGTIAESYK